MFVGALQLLVERTEAAEHVAFSQHAMKLDHVQACAPKLIAHFAEAFVGMTVMLTEDTLAMVILEPHLATRHVHDIGTGGTDQIERPHHPGPGLFGAPHQGRQPSG